MRLLGRRGLLLMLLIHDRYELGPLLGSGAMADVFEAYDHRLQRRVAIKQLRDEALVAGGLGPDARSRFAHEARAGARLTHPNAAAIYDYGADDHPPFLVMELVDGPTLASAVRRRGPLPLPDALSIADQVLAALGAAHALGIVHRDVKPANIMLAGDGVVKLVDFGVAKSVGPTADGDATATGLVVGTPRYLAPEQRLGDPATPRSDLYAVGLVLRGMLTGTAPDANLGEQRPGLPPFVHAAIERALAPDPAARFPSSEAMRDALRRAPGDDTVASDVVDPTRTAVVPVLEPVTTRQPSRGGRARWFVATVAVAALVVGGFALAGTAGDTNAKTGAVAAAPSTVPSTAATTTTAPSPPTTVALRATTLPELASLLTSGAYGSASGDLLDELQRSLEHLDRKGHRAQKLQEQIAAWVAAGELDPRVGSLASALLQTSVSADPGD